MINWDRSDPNTQQTRLVDWPFFPILNGTNNSDQQKPGWGKNNVPQYIGYSKGRRHQENVFAQIFCQCQVLTAPAKIDFEFLQIAPDIKQFTVHDTAVAALLEGNFRSLYAGRIPKIVH